MSRKRNRKSKFDNYTDEELQQILDTSSSRREVVERIGLSDRSGNKRTLQLQIDKRNLSTKKLEENKQKSLIQNAKRSSIMAAIPLEEILVENSTYTNMNSLKRRLVNAGILKYECKICGISSWNGKKLSLQLDHKNGIHSDNRIENIRLLCPNCHSQTDTYGGKNIKNS